MSEDDKPELGLDDAYGVKSPEDNRKLYAGWADTYESAFVADSRYIYPHNVSVVFADGFNVDRGPVLDVGCGTGMVGEELRRLGVNQIDGIDISPEMLAKAKQKTDATGPVYRDLIEADLTKPVDLPSARYGGVISVGAFTHGHLGADVVNELLRLAKPGARFALGINAAYFEAHGFAAGFNRHASDGAITNYQIVEAIIYGDSDADNLDQVARIAVFDLAGGINTD